jgi:hypothetical protein
MGRHRRSWRAQRALWREPLQFAQVQERWQERRQKWAQPGHVLIRPQIDCISPPILLVAENNAGVRNRVILSFILGLVAIPVKVGEGPISINLSNAKSLKRRS